MSYCSANYERHFSARPGDGTYDGYHEVNVGQGNEDRTTRNNLKKLVPSTIFAIAPTLVVCSCRSRFGAAG